MVLTDPRYNSQRKDLGSTNFNGKCFLSGTAALNNVTVAGTLGTTGDLTA